MKKVLAAIAVMAGAGFAAQAQEPVKCDNKVCPEQAQLCDQQQCAPQQCAPCPFDGLNLTEDQKTKIKALGQAKFDARNAKKAEKAQAKAQAKADRREARNAARREELAKIKEILTPEQYVQFLENSWVDAKKDFGPRAKQFRGPKGVKPGKDGKAGPRPERGPRK